MHKLIQPSLFYCFAESYCCVEDEGTGKETVGASRETGRGSCEDSKGIAEEDPESDSSSLRISICKSDLKL